VPLEHALFEHEIGWHIGQRGRVLPADCFNYCGAIVSDAGTGLPLDRGACDHAYQCRHGAGQQSIERLQWFAAEVSRSRQAEAHHPGLFGGPDFPAELPAA
jgi:hypothetical protein